jgi:coenzyme Q-binding protein COQ10
MYAVVADVERYPEFLPWCAGLRVLSRAPENGREIVMAEMIVGYKAIRERYTSRVTLDLPARAIDVVQTDGPFRTLENHWRFAPEKDQCRVDFTIEFEFRNRVLGMVANAALDTVMFRMSAAFEARAKVLSKKPLQ